MKTLLPFHSHIMLHAGSLPAVLRTPTMPAKSNVTKLLRKAQRKMEKIQKFLDDDYKDQ